MYKWIKGRLECSNMITFKLHLFCNYQNHKLIGISFPFFLFFIYLIKKQNFFVNLASFIYNFRIMKLKNFQFHLHLFKFLFLFKVFTYLRGNLWHIKSSIAIAFKSRSVSNLTCVTITSNWKNNLEWTIDNL